MIDIMQYVMIWILLIISNSFAYDPPKVFAGKNGAIIYDVATGECVKNDSGECKRIPKETEIKFFMLNSNGEKYEEGKNQTPYLYKNKPRLGFIYEDKIIALEEKDLTKKFPMRTGIRTPKVEQSGKYKSYKNPVMQKIKEFHNSTCDSLRPETPEKMDKEIENLKTEWDEFIKNQNSDEEKEIAEKARQADLVSRTILFETHKLGYLDNKKPSECANDEDCANSACERKVITLSIYNRGNHKSCNSGHSYFGCKYLKDYAGVATEPSQYSIWNPSFTSSFMTTCFLKDGLMKSRQAGEDYKNSILEFKKTVKTVLETLDTDTPFKNIEYSESGDGPEQGIENFRNYFHPQSMFGCFLNNYENQYSVQSTYIEKGNDYGLIALETIFPDDESAEKTKFKLQKWRKDYTSENVSYDLARYNQQDDWLISKDQMKKIKLSNNCVPMGLGILKNKPDMCSDVKHEHSFTSPKWAIENGAKRATFTCHVGSKTVSLGGECDIRFQPISGVP